MSKIEIEASGEDAADRRRFERAGMVVRVEYATVDDLFSEFTRDINEGGVFIETDDPQPLGSIVQLQFLLPGSDAPVKTEGMVVRHEDGTGGGMPGMAVEFGDLGPTARERINDVIRSMKPNFG